MPGTSAAAKAKIKFKVPADAIVTVTNGEPEPIVVQVNPRGTVQFVNKDDKDYRLRLWTSDSMSGTPTLICYCLVAVASP